MSPSIGIIICFMFVYSVIICYGQTSVTTFATFESIGIIIKTNDDPLFETTPFLQYKEWTDSTYLNGHFFTRRTINKWISSLFQLHSGTLYNIKITFVGGKILNNSVITTQENTRNYDDLQLSKWQSNVVNNTYYISPNGIGTECSLINPCLFETANTMLTDDEMQEIIFLEGIYYNINNIDTMSWNTILRGNDGDIVMIDGSYPDKYYEWRLLTDLDNIYETNINGLGEPYVVIANNQRMYQYEYLMDLVNGTNDGYHYFDDNIYIKFKDNNIDPNTIQFDIARYKDGFIPKSNTYFYNLNFINYGQSKYSQSIYIEYADNIIIKNCTFHHCSNGVSLNKGYKNIIIDGNIFSDTKFEFDIDVFHESEGGGFKIYSSNEGGQGLIIKDNTFHDLFNCLDIMTSKPMNNLITNEIDIYNNILFKCSNNAILFGSYCSNCRVWNNMIYQSLIGFSIAHTSFGPSYFFRNTMYYLGSSKYNGFSFKTNSDDESGQNILAGIFYIYHNTIYDVELNDENAWFTQNGNNKWELIVLRNNIFVSTSYPLRSDQACCPIYFDSNCYYSINKEPNELIKWFGTRYSLYEFQQETSMELNGIEFLPTFINKTNHNYHLHHILDDILIDTAQIIYGINIPFIGNGPDFGAFESENEGIPDHDIPNTNNEKVQNRYHTYSFLVAVAVIILFMICMYLVLKRDEASNASNMNITNDKSRNSISYGAAAFISNGSVEND